MGLGHGASSTREQRLVLLCVVALAVADVAALAAHTPGASDATARPAGASVATTGPQAAAPSTSSDTPVAVTPTRPVRDTRGSLPKAEETPAKPAASLAAEYFPVSANGLAYEATVTPTCGRPGAVFNAVVHVRPNTASAASVMPFYADGSNEQGVATVAGPDGTVRYTWTARPVIGEGRLVTQAHDGETQKSGTKIVGFRVAESESEC